MSALEDKLAGQLDLASRDEQARWPYAAPVREYRPDAEGCCGHAPRFHDAGRCRWAEVCGCEGFRAARRWRVDFAWPASKVAVEVEGIVYAKQGESVGRHQTGAGYERDLEKYGWLQTNGWLVVRVGRRQITSGEAMRLIEHALRERSGE